MEHSEYDESAVHQLYRSVLSSGLAFGARRWVATLQRYCECMSILMSPTISAEDQTGLALLSDTSFFFLLGHLMANVFYILV